MRPAQPITALEATFLGLESRDVPFVHASILSFDRPIPLDALRAHVDAALAGIPRYRQRIARTPFGSAAWVDDDDFRIDHQILAASVAAPGGTRELDELAAHLLAAELPAGHPPWRLYTVHGLAGGCGAVISLFHHALVDGIGGFQLLEYVLRATPAIAAASPPVAAPGRLAAARRLVTWDNVTALARLLRDGVSPASQIGLNPRHTGHARAVASHSVELGALKQIARAFDATANDVVLATVAGALRRFLHRRGVDPAQLHDVRAMVPVGRHTKDAREPSGNQVVLLLAQLPVDEADPAECVRRVAATTRALKAGHSVAGGDLLVALSDATTPALLVGAMRLALRMRGFNLIVTNVPGPPTPLSLLGAQLTRIVPIVNLWPHQAIGIAVASYAGTMTFGIQTDRDVIPDAAQLRDDLAAAFELLRTAATSRTTLAFDGAPRVQPMHPQVS
jgi:diacylglycerol O-acyltransferase / wax synthase